MFTKKTIGTSMIAASLGAFACGGTESELGTEDRAAESSDPVIAAAGADTSLSYGARAITQYGVLATENAALTCTSATAAYGYITILEVSTGRFFSVVAAGAYGPVTVDDQSGHGAVALAVGATLDASAGSANLAAGILGHYRLPAGITMPSDVASANALFDEAFGASSRHGVSLDRVVTVGYRQPTTVAYWGSGTFDFVLRDGRIIPASLAVGIVLRDGQVFAVHTSGTAGMASYVR